ncbi:MAG TPA: hypothetical protein VK028_08095 [Micromonosporaceae bacterium]|nr:hypothetical protein [Micromonosporaceae bacterium]
MGGGFFDIERVGVHRGLRAHPHALRTTRRPQASRQPGQRGHALWRVGRALGSAAEGAIEIRRTSFDIDAACARITAESAYPGAGEFADYFVRSRASDVDALRVFGPRDGRAA